MTDVTQADREAAADLWAKVQNMSWVWWQDEWIRAGDADNGPLVAAFAAHRKAAIEECAKRLEREWPGPAASIVRALAEDKTND